MRPSGPSLLIHRQSEAKCHTFRPFTLSRGLLIALAERSFVRVCRRHRWERGLAAASGPGEKLIAARNKTRKVINLINDANSHGLDHHYCCFFPISPAVGLTGTPLPTHPKTHIHTLTHCTSCTGNTPPPALTPPHPLVCPVPLFGGMGSDY